MPHKMMPIETPELSVDEPGADEIERDQYLIFVSMDQEFGIQAMGVKEISALIEITKVPRSPSYIEGILNLRGRLVSVINFRQKFGFESKAHDEDTRIVIVEHRGFPIGILVDRVEEVIRIPSEKVMKLPEAAVSPTDTYLTGVGMLDKRLIVLLDADQLLIRTEVIELDALQQATAEIQNRHEVAETATSKAQG